MTVCENKSLLVKQKDILVVDVGSGTQDVLVYQADKNIKNCPKLVMPSRTQIVARQIQQATKKGRSIYI